jgi:hypothetical protein
MINNLSSHRLAKIAISALWLLVLIHPGVIRAAPDEYGFSSFPAVETLCAAPPGPDGPRSTAPVVTVTNSLATFSGGFVSKTINGWSLGGANIYVTLGGEVCGGQTFQPCTGCSSTIIMDFSDPVHSASSAGYSTPEHAAIRLVAILQVTVGFYD